MNIGIYLQLSASKWNEIYLLDQQRRRPREIPDLRNVSRVTGDDYIAAELIRSLLMTSADTLVLFILLSIRVSLADTVGRVLAIDIQGEAVPVLVPLLRPRPPVCQPPLGAVVQLRAVARQPLLLPAGQVACNGQFSTLCHLLSLNWTQAQAYISMY